MASIFKQVTVDVDVDTAWAALRRVGEARVLFAPVLTESRLQGAIRTVRFADGTVIREQILDIDDARRRVAYAALDSPGMTYHHASMSLVDAGPGRCHFVWVTDFLPPELAAAINPLIEQGSAALKRNLEKG